jgi:hypothetical protein
MTKEMAQVLKILANLQATGSLLPAEFDAVKKKMLSPQPAKADNLGVGLGFLKALLWPLLTFFVLINFRDLIISRLSNAQEISVANIISLKASQKALFVGDKNLSAILKNSTSEEIGAILGLGKRPATLISEQSYKSRDILVLSKNLKVFKTLEFNGLIKRVNLAQNTDFSNLDDFEKSFENFGEQTFINYKSDDPTKGSSEFYSYSKDHSVPVLYRYIEKKPSDPKWKNFTDTGFIRLTDNGVLAYDLILKVLGDQVANPVLEQKPQGQSKP